VVQRESHVNKSNRAKERDVRERERSADQNRKKKEKEIEGRKKEGKEGEKGQIGEGKGKKEKRGGNGRPWLASSLASDTWVAGDLGPRKGRRRVKVGCKSS